MFSGLLGNDLGAKGFPLPTITRSEAGHGNGFSIIMRRKDREEYCVFAQEWRPQEKRRVGRPKTTWSNMVENERREDG